MSDPQKNLRRQTLELESIAHDVRGRPEGPQLPHEQRSGVLIPPSEDLRHIATRCKSAPATSHRCPETPAATGRNPEA